MSRNKKLSYVILAIVFIVVSIVVFVLPTEKTASFWVTYAFTCIAFAVQIYIWNVGIKDNAPLKSKFLGIPIIRVGYVYLIVQLIALLVFLICPFISVRIAVIACVLICGISAVCMITADVGSEIVSSIDEKVKTKVTYIRELQVDVEMAAERESDPLIKQKLLGLAEKIRYSDPVSSDSLSEIEHRIMDKVRLLSDTDNKAAEVDEIELLLLERNKKCKIYKDM